jgi:hypothetical protein
LFSLIFAAFGKAPFLTVLPISALAFGIAGIAWGYLMWAWGEKREAKKIQETDPR